MDDSERDEILYRLDERTERIDGRLERVDERVHEQDEVIKDVHAKVGDDLLSLDQRVTRNTTILSAITLGLSTFVAAIVTKFHSLFP
jgi:hypothetical protein